MVQVHRAPPSSRRDQGLQLRISSRLLTTPLTHTYTHTCNAYVASVELSHIQKELRWRALLEILLLYHPHYESVSSEEAIQKRVNVCGESFHLAASKQLHK